MNIRITMALRETESWNASNIAEVIVMVPIQAGDTPATIAARCGAEVQHDVAGLLESPVNSQRLAEVTANEAAGA